MPQAQRIGIYKSKPVYRIPVRIDYNDSRQCRTIATQSFTVVSHSAVEAANWARDLIADRAETEVRAYGPKGGETYRYIGWESSIFHQMIAKKPAEQLRLELEMRP